ncbi:MAG TPA: S41 family peptidase [Candidatus Sulfotelmatobacter sp.]|nr:S41 family peptidase [Candidatus Sulfotelmatobacter sp.]
MRNTRISHVVQVCSVIVLLAGSAWPQQQMSGQDRGRAQDVLKFAAADVRKHYYDPKFHGLDWDAKVAEAKEKIDKAPTWNVAMSHIAGAFDALNDSHTFFLPPAHVGRTDYGFQYQIIGDRCFILRVRPGSDAEAKGIKAGDELLGLNNFGVNRNTLWRLQYAFNVLRPQPSMSLVLQDPAGGQRKVDAAAKIRAGKPKIDLSGDSGDSDFWDWVRESQGNSHLLRGRSAEFGDALMVLKLPEFFFSDEGVEGMLSKAKKHQALIVDLRGDPGGSVETLRALVGGMFEKEVKIADTVSRKDTKPLVSKSMGNKFTGKLVVLVDSGSASASELFARVMQLEKRGTVMGDRSSGSVMESKRYSEQMGADTVIFYGASITEADLIMSDGKSLEHVGVVPDEIALPTGQDLAAGRDPVLAHAAETLGVKLSPEDAGKAFPYEWPPE